MAKISLAEAAKLVPASKSTLYRDAAERKFSWEKNQKGRKVVDPAELERFYGKLNSITNSNRNSQSDPTSQNGNNKIIPLLEQKIGFLESQLSDKKEQVSELWREKEKLLGIVEKQTLMLEDKRKKPEMLEESPPKSDRWLVWGLGVFTLIVGAIAVAAIYYLQAGS